MSDVMKELEEQCRAEATEICDRFHRGFIGKADLVDAIAAALKKRAGEVAAIEELRIMQLAGISTASVQNTEASAKDRIDESNPFWSVAYADVCRAIDREMRHRALADQADERTARAESRIRTLEEALEEVKFECLTMVHTPGALARIVRICIDAGIVKKLPELQTAHTEREAKKGHQ